MDDKRIFKFESELSDVDIPDDLNNPFGRELPEIARLAAAEFQSFISAETKNFQHDFQAEKGKMFGVLVVRRKDGTLGFLGAVSGNLSAEASAERLVPSVFDNASNGHFIDKGMKALTEIGDRIKYSDDRAEKQFLKKKRKQKSLHLQQQLFENYNFRNVQGQVKNVIEIFAESSGRHPPSAAGECAAPKLLEYAFSKGLDPIALAEFWWGNPKGDGEREHRKFYPACQNKCRPILEFMLDDSDLFYGASKT